MRMIIRMMDLIECIADAIDLVSPEVNHHHRKVVCISHAIGQAYGLSTNQLENLIIAAAVHDIGALSLKKHLRLLDFDENDEMHAINGARLLNEFKPFAHIAPIIRHHHTYWQNRDRKISGRQAEEIPIKSCIIHLADRISVLVKSDFQLNHVGEIVEKINSQSGFQFHPDLVAIFNRLALKESFWLDARDAVVQPMLKYNLARNLHLTTDELMALGKMFRQVIDFRSSFTATHSTGVATVARTLASLHSFSEDECLMMQLAGDFHDIGKLVVPESILEKQGPLSPDEFSIIRSHTYYTNRLLGSVTAFDTIRIWGALHHERLNGKGYPFRYNEQELPLGSRIMAVADIFTAITEDRPYRSGMKKVEVLRVMSNMVKQYAIDERIVKVLMEHYDFINDNRILAQEEALQDYRSFYQ